MTSPADKWQMRIGLTLAGVGLALLVALIAAAAGAS